MSIANGGGGNGVAVASSRCFPGEWGATAAAKPCDYCKIGMALVFCCVDSVFMCLGCDTKVHVTNKLGSKHERVWVCEVCEHAPAAVTCKADAAALCVTCDRDIHSANPLAQRHERIPVVPFYDTAESVVKSTAATLLVPINDSNPTPNFAHDNFAAASDPWTSSASKLPENPPAGMKSVEFSLFDSDNFLDFDYPVSWESNSQNQYNNSDRVVPIQTIKTTAAPIINQEKHFEIDFTRSNITSYNSGFNKPSLSVSSSLDVGVVPDGSCVSEISYRNMGGGSVDSRGGGSQWNGMDREARVLRYREKRKNRKFEKTIRYASRKAYAETRPRIKGRFAKRTEVESESDIDTLFSSADSVADVGRFSVVPLIW